MKIAYTYLQAYTLLILFAHTLMHTQMHTNWLEGKDRDKNVDLYFFIWPACNLVWNLSLMNCLATVGRERAQLFHFSKQETTKMMQQPSTCSKTITYMHCFRKHLLNSAVSVGGNKTKPRPLRPRNRNMVLEWFIKEERDKGSGLDPATGKVAQWFHGELAYVWPPCAPCLPTPFLPQVWELSVNRQISASVKLTPWWKKNCPWGKEIGVQKKKKHKQKGNTEYPWNNWSVFTGGSYSF